jgi:arsenic resistance protein ArsH
MPTLDKLAPVGEFNHPPRILMLYGSLRERSFSRFLTGRRRASWSTSAPR